LLLALADDDDAVHVHGLQHEAHGVDGGLVGGLLVAHADQARGGERRRLGDADELEGEVAVGPGGLIAHQMVPGGLRARSCSEERRAAPAIIASTPISARNQPYFSEIALDGSPGRPMTPL